MQGNSVKASKWRSTAWYKKAASQILDRNAAWTFIRQPTPGCTIPELHVKVQPGRDVFDFVGIAVVAKAGYAGRLLETDRFLFLHGDYSKFASKVLPRRRWKCMELLIDEPHWGKIFIHGIFLTNALTYKKFGLNYTGAQSLCCCMMPFIFDMSHCFKYSWIAAGDKTF